MLIVLAVITVCSVRGSGSKSTMMQRNNYISASAHELDNRNHPVKSSEGSNYNYLFTLFKYYDIKYIL